MNFFEKIVYFLQAEMTRPNPYGWFHLLCIFLTITAIVVLFLLRKKYNEKQLKIVLAIYGVVAFILELTKQIIWAYDYDLSLGIGTWNYEWYAAPFQLCTTPIYVSIICLFLNKGKIRDSLLSYVSYITILGSVMTIIIPDSCFVETTLVNIHTMWLHCGGLVLSLYLMFTGEVKLRLKDFKNAIIVFLIFVFIAEMLNIGIYNSGILNGNEFNMFYISPYFTSSLPVYNTVQGMVPFPIFLMLYILSICLGGLIVFGFIKLSSKLKSRLIKE